MIPAVGLWYACTVHSPQDEGGDFAQTLLRTREGWRSLTGDVIGCEVTPIRWAPHPAVTYIELAILIREAVELGDACAEGRKRSSGAWREFAQRVRGRVVL